MIRRLREEYPTVSVRTLCAVLGVSRSWFYAAQRRPPPAPDAADLVARIEAIVLAHPGYGYRRVTAELHRQGTSINHKRVIRVMRQASLLCQVRRYVQTTHRQPGFRRYPNLMREQTLTGADQVWVADVTYLHFPHGTGFLACVLDAWSRRCIGWALSDQLNTALTEQALNQAIASRTPEPGLIHHSDQGVQYANHRYIGRLRQIGAQVSMSATGRPTDNARIESFFSTLKREEVWLNDYQNVADARQQLSRFIEEVYNTKRLHSSLGYCPPAEYEKVAA